MDEMLFSLSVENAILKKSEKKEVIAFDFFDTIMFRHVHSHQLMMQWSRAMKRKFCGLKNIDLVSLRQDIIKSSNLNECEINYNVLVSLIYERLVAQTIILPPKDEFFTASYLIDYSIDLATQFPNRNMVDVAKKLKSNGKRIVLITDYYLPGISYKKYLNQYGIAEVFDKIYCSSDYGQSKYNGNLYKCVLDELAIEPSKVLMIGDSKKSDYENALSQGMDAYRYFPVFHKLLTNYRKLTNYSFQKYGARDVFDSSYNHTLFGEYSLNLFFFSRELFNCATKENVGIISFLSRGGYFLQKCFDYYALFTNEDVSIKSLYLKNSRKVNKKADTSDEDAILLKKYIEPFLYDYKLCVVDEGWYCTSQSTIQNRTKYETIGFYIGIMGRDEKDIEHKRKGILFDVDEAGKETPLYGVFRTNCTFYEQLLSAPHGSAIAYEESEGGINVIEVWQEKEKVNYFENIKPIQKIILEYLGGLAVWDCELTKYELACYVLKTLLFANQDRLNLEDKIIDNWYDNANDTTEKKFGRMMDIKFNPFVAFVKPEKYLRYFCKLKNLKLKYGFMRFAYPLLGTVIYLMCRISIFLKYRDEV